MIEPLEARTFFSGGPAVTSDELTLIGRLPRATLVAGQRIAPVVQLLRITNSGATPINESAQFTLGLSTVLGDLTGSTPVISITRRLNLLPGHRALVPFVIRALPAAPTGALFVITSLTDATGSVAVATSATSITVAAPVIDLVAQRIIAPATARIGRKAIIPLVIANVGDVPAVGNLSVDVQASTTAIDTPATNIDLGTITRRVIIGPKRRIIFALPVTLPSSGGPYYLVANVDPTNTFSESTLTNNSAISITAVSRAPVAVSTVNALTIKLTKLTTIPAAFSTPQDIVTAPGVADNQYITARHGDVLIFSNGTLSPTPLLDYNAAGVQLYLGGEGGLLGEAFSPTFSVPGTFGYGKFYTFDTEPFSTTGPAADFSQPELFPTTNILPTNQMLIREWSLASPQATVAGTASRVLLRIDHPQSNHQGGSLRFGPDGNLYIGLGDGGGADDFNGPPTDPTDGHTNATGNAQDPTVVFGKILRINPNPAAGAGYTPSVNGQYSTPTDNPFAAGGGLKEIYALGLRNPYRMSFDSLTGNLYVGNVGQGAIESVDLVTNGGNYGWPYYEGTRNNQQDTGRTAPAGFSFTTPIAEYTHADGNAIIGGVVDRSTAVPSLNGLYVFGDLGGVTGTIGRLFYSPVNGGQISAFKYDPTGITPSSNLFGFGTDSHGTPEAFFSNGDILMFSATK